MKLSIYIIFGIILVSEIFAQTDSIKTYNSMPLVITAKKNISLFDAMYSGTDFNSRLFDRNGNALIRRGLSFTQDIYSEGFRRNDIKIVVDGEQYHNACPNRMDAPAGRINPFEMEYVEMSKSGSQRGAGIYGKIEYHRKTIADGITGGLFLTTNQIAQQEYDAGFNFGYDGIGINTRISTGSPYQNGESKDFKSLYGYKDNFKYLNARVSLRGNHSDFKYGVSFNQLEDISFPYLLMDEVFTRVYNVDFAYKSHKIYMNYTDHLMNNTLRVSPMFMESDAKNLTIGLVGDFYEITYRNWKSDNVMINPAMNVNMTNKMLPDISQIYGGVNHKIDFNDFIFSGRIAAVYLGIGNKDPLDFYKALYPDPSDNRMFVSGGLNVTYSNNIANSIDFAISGELALESPEAEQLFINVRKPGTTPDWSGNPTLDQAMKSNLRIAFNNEYVALESYFNYISNYVDLSKANNGTKGVLTYSNINAIIAGFNLVLRYDIFQSNISYIYGENTENKMPLSEIMPLSVTNSLQLPEFYGINVALIHRYENYQPRINIDLKEFESASWNTLSMMLSYSYKNLLFRAEAENLLNHNYYKHLSFSRNPFSAGVPVFETGTSLRLTIIYDNIF